MKTLMLAFAVLAPYWTGQPDGADLPDIKQHGRLRLHTAVQRSDDEFFSLLDKTDRPGFDREAIEGFTRLHRLPLDSSPAACPNMASPGRTARRAARAI